MKTIGLLLTLCLFFCVSNVSAQQPTPNKTKKIDSTIKSSFCGGGILNLLAVSLRNLYFPKRKDQELRGAVNVQVTIDEEGKLISASAVSGRQELRKYAEEAVKKSTFKRFVKCGKPIKLTSVIVYNFTLPE